MKQIIGIMMIAVLLGSPGVFAAKEPTIADIVVGATEAGEPQFTILLAALDSNPELAERLSSNGKVTVFAPTDAAFLDLLDELTLTAEQLLANTELVATVLEYHVVPGNRDAAEVLESDKLRTLSKGFLHVDAENGALVDANNRVANIIDTNIMASNGIIHVIDRVVLP
jgi:uncharacterized surface protein with fasciclin (FAS1) repeats